jgi:hypothetical protein
MKKLVFTIHIFTISVLLISCTKTDTGLTSNDINPATFLKAPALNSGSMSGRETVVPPVSTCTPTVVTLFAGQTINAGSVTVSNDASFIYVTYNTANGYVLTQTHLFVGECALIPVNRPGNAIPGQFPYASAHNNLTSYTYQVPISSIRGGSCGCIAALAVVSLASGGGTQTGWGNGTVINPTGQWGMKFDYCSCE